MTAPAKRIALIHALTDSQQPAWDAFAKGWPQARIHNLLDDSLAKDLAVEGEISPNMFERFLTLGRYSASTGTASDRPAAILFTCSAFGPAINKVKDALAIPVLRPNEAAFEKALGLGKRIGLMVSFKNALPPLMDELQQMARDCGKEIEISSAVAEGALEALKAGDAPGHDAIVARTAAELKNTDALVLCQFSLARAADSIAAVPGQTVLTTPDSAVQKLKAMLQD